MSHNESAARARARGARSACRGFARVALGDHGDRGCGRHRHVRALQQARGPRAAQAREVPGALRRHARGDVVVTRASVSRPSSCRVRCGGAVRLVVSRCRNGSSFGARSVVRGWSRGAGTGRIRRPFGGARLVAVVSERAVSGARAPSVRREARRRRATAAEHRDRHHRREPRAPPPPPSTPTPSYRPSPVASRPPSSHGAARVLGPCLVERSSRGARGRTTS